MNTLDEAPTTSRALEVLDRMEHLLIHLAGLAEIVGYLAESASVVTPGALASLGVSLVDATAVLEEHRREAHDALKGATDAAG